VDTKPRSFHITRNGPSPITITVDFVLGKTVS
jgi:hypothetical protein